MSIAEQLKSYIRATGETHYHLCKQTGISQSNISRFMAGKSGLDLTTIEKLAKYFCLELRQNPPTNKGR
ncbi:MAG: helix-turn-helix domain-containing protein [Phycisphaerae bacterium]